MNEETFFKKLYFERIMLPIDATTERGQQMRDCCGMFDPGWHGRFGVEVDQLPHVGHPPYLRQ